MQDFPHYYQVAAKGAAQGDVTVSSVGLPDLSTTAPPEFGGPEGSWSPESLMTAAVADCFILTFRAVARASNLEWESLNCEVKGVLDQENRVTRFTRFEVSSVLRILDEAKRDKAERCLDKAERACLVTNSLTAEVVLSPRVETADTA